MGDCTLLKEDIKQAVKEYKLLEPFDEKRLKGASYDIAAGETVILVYAEEFGGISPLSLSIKGSINIPPGHEFIVYSLEKVNIPSNMKGRLSLRSHLATQLISFAGGIIDPGYKGFLFLPLANLGDSPFTITYGQPLVVAEFTRLAKPTDTYTEEPILRISKDRLPTLPTRRVYDILELSKRIDDANEQIKDLSEKIKDYGPQITATKALIEFVILAAIGGSLAGIILALLSRIPEHSIWAIPTVGILFALLCFFIIRILRR